MIMNTVNRKKILEQLVEEIKEQDKKGWGYRDVKNLAEKYGYTTANIYRIRYKLKKDAKTDN